MASAIITIRWDSDGDAQGELKEAIHALDNEAFEVVSAKVTEE
jgi:hypothetical protein